MPRQAGKTWMVPWAPDGSLMHHAVEWRAWPEIGAWREPEPFHGSLRLMDGVRAGRSAKYLMWSADDGRTFPMFVVDFVDMARDFGIPRGALVHGRWVVRKRGQNYGVALDST